MKGLRTLRKLANSGRSSGEKMGLEIEMLTGMRTVVNSQVPAPPDENDVELDSRRAVGVWKRKKNWSTPGPDRVTDYW